MTINPSIMYLIVKDLPQIGIGKRLRLGMLIQIFPVILLVSYFVIWHNNFFKSLLIDTLLKMVILLEESILL